MTRCLSLNWDGHPFVVHVGPDGVECVTFDTEQAHPSPSSGAWDKSPDADRCMDAVHQQLEAYWKGLRHTFSLPLALPEATPWRRAVWAVLRTIPYGSILTYRDIAAGMGQPGAARAVGQACGANPLPIFLPCHRVVSAGGYVGGYAGGARMKQRLLQLEGVETLRR